MGNWLSPVKIIDSTLIAASLSTNPESKIERPDVTMTATTNIEHMEKREGVNLAKCVLSVDAAWHEPGNQDNTALSAMCSVGIIVGVHDASFDADEADDEKAQYLDANAISLAYGKIRAFIEEITSQSFAGRQVLPAIDPYALLDSISEQKASE